MIHNAKTYYIVQNSFLIYNLGVQKKILLFADISQKSHE